MDQNQHVATLDQQHLLPGQLAGGDDAVAGEGFRQPGFDRRRVAAALRTPIQCGENWWGVEDMRTAIDARASDYMMPDVMKIGGVSGWLQAAALGAAHGIRLSNHLFVEVSTHLLSATPTAHWLEYAEWFNPIIEQPLRIVDGCTVLDERPGSGVEWNEEAVRRYLVE